jgi:hypothetical protein
MKAVGASGCSFKTSRERENPTVVSRLLLNGN